MTSFASHRRGDPLAALALVLVGWVIVRALFWTALGSPMNLPAVMPPPLSAGAEVGGARVNGHRVVSLPATHDAGAPKAKAPASLAKWREPRALARVVMSDLMRTEPRLEPSNPVALQPSSQDLAERAALPSIRAEQVTMPSPKRVSLDTWIVLREGGRGQSALGLQPASLGASQAGVVVRYAIAPEHGLHPAAYVRVSRALAENGESEAAVGALVRPLPRVPVAAHAELRLTRQGERLETRPAVFLTGGVNDAPLAKDVTLRAYGQAGYVGGSYATGFADGQVVAEKLVASTLRVGAGAWGGVQKGASRIDAGPTVSLTVPVAGATVRAEATYRVRIAGDAQPDSGLALTVAAGF